MNKTTVINLNSSFDWTRDIDKMLSQVGAFTASNRVGIPSEKNHIERAMQSLRYVFLISELTLARQLKDNSRGEAGSTPAERSNESEGPQDDGEENHIYLQPRRCERGAVVEALGIYARNARRFAESEPAGRYRPGSLSRERSNPEGLAELLREDVGEEPAIFLCPERLFGLPVRLAKKLSHDDPHPSANLNLSELFLRMTLLHEIGHHVFPVETDHPQRIFLSEALANLFCHSMLRSDEERQWLFVKASFLQPSAYLAYTAPRVLPNIIEQPDRWRQRWHATLEAVLRGRSSEIPLHEWDLQGHWGDRHLPNESSPQQALSPKLRRALMGLSETLEDSQTARDLARINTTCVRPFEEWDALRTT